MKYTFENNKITNCYDCPCCIYPNYEARDEFYQEYICSLLREQLMIKVISEKHKDCPLKGEE